MTVSSATVASDPVVLYENSLLSNPDYIRLMNAGQSPLKKPSFILSLQFIKIDDFLRAERWIVRCRLWNLEFRYCADDDTEVYEARALFVPSPRVRILGTFSSAFLYQHYHT